MLPSLGALSLHEATQPLSTAGKKNSTVVDMDESDEEDEGDEPDEPTRPDAVALRNVPPGFRPSRGGRSGRGKDGLLRGRGRGRGTNPTAPDPPKPTAPDPPKAKKKVSRYSNETPRKRMQDEAERQRMQQQLTKLSDLAGDDGPLTIIMAFLAKRLAPDEDALLNSDMKTLCDGVLAACRELRVFRAIRMQGLATDPYDCANANSPIWKAAMVVFGIDPTYENRWRRDGELITGRLYPNWNEIRILTDEDKLARKTTTNWAPHETQSWVLETARPNAPETKKKLFMDACRAFGGPIRFHHGKTLFGGAPAPIPQPKELWKQLVGSDWRVRFLHTALPLDEHNLGDDGMEARIKEFKHALCRPIKCVDYGDVAMAVATDALKWRLRHLPMAAGIVGRALKHNRRFEPESEDDFKEVQGQIYALLWVISKLWEQCLPVFDTLCLAHREVLYKLIVELCAKSESGATDMVALFGTMQDRNIDVFLLYEASGDPMEVGVRKDAWERLRELVEEGRITMTAISADDHVANSIRVA